MASSSFGSFLVGSSTMALGWVSSSASAKCFTSGLWMEGSGAEDTLVLLLRALFWWRRYKK